MDRYKGYDKLFTLPGATAVEVGYWSHAQRYLAEALKAGDVRAAVAVKAVRELFAVERLADEQRVDQAEWLRLRNEQSRPVLEELEQWLRATYECEPPRSPLAQAFHYALNQWKPLSHCLEDAKLPLHNNASEELWLREIAVGRKNWMFADRDAGAQRSACVYTLVATCVLAGVDPWRIWPTCYRTWRLAGHNGASPSMEGRVRAGHCCTSLTTTAWLLAPTRCLHALSKGGAELARARFSATCPSV